MSYRRKKRSSSRRTCVRHKRVHVRGQGMAYRCVKYRGRGKRPFNKGKKCLAKGRDRRGRIVCRSYGARPRHGRRKAQGPMTSQGTFRSFYGGPQASAMQAPSWLTF